MLMWKNNDSMTIRRFYLMYDDTISMARWFDDAQTWYFITSLVHCAIATSSLRHCEVVIMSLQFRHRAVALSSRYLPVLSPLIYGNRQRRFSKYLPILLSSLLTVLTGLHLFQITEKLWSSINGKYHGERKHLITSGLIRTITFGSV